jgi:2-oxoglutarate decarboxylase
MSESHPPEFGINSWLEDELYQEYLHDRRMVDESWKKVFESNGEEAPSGGSGVQTSHPVSVLEREPAETLPIPIPEHQPVAGETLIPLRGAPARIAENMNASLSIPLATSQRVIPVKVIDENRRILNEHRTLLGKPKISYTHIIGWAIVKAIRTSMWKLSTTSCLELAQTS